LETAEGEVPTDVGRNKGYSLDELAQRFGLETAGDGATRIEGVCTLSPGKPRHLGFLANSRYRGQLASTQAGAVVVSPADAEGLSGPGLIAKDPHLAYTRIAALFDPRREFAPGRHPSAVIAPTARVGEGSWIGPLAVIEDRAEIAAGCFIGAACVIGAEARIGAGSRLEANVWVGERARIGRRASIQPGAVIGGRGFGLARSAQGWEEVPQLGSVVIGDGVEVGANTTIDRGALEDTVIEDGVKLDNQIQIAHNCRIGAHTAIAACVGIAGSTRIGARCMIGGAAGIGGHLEIADDVVVLGGSMVTKKLSKAGVYGSTLPAHDARLWRRTVVHMRRLPQYEERLRAIEQRLEIEAKDEGDGGEDDV
jgi:UDP-3-O-[3-hydroxymyristoyl] glucosamine N-acyltransferase